jgi:hypothetical protein
VDDVKPDNVEVVGVSMQVSCVGIWADMATDEQVGDQAADDAQLVHQRPERHRDGQAC